MTDVIYIAIWIGLLVILLHLVCRQLVNWCVERADERDSILGAQAEAPTWPLPWKSIGMFLAGAFAILAVIGYFSLSTLSILLLVMTVVGGPLLVLRLVGMSLWEFLPPIRSIGGFVSRVILGVMGAILISRYVTGVLFAWPPVWVEHWQHRQIVAERVSAGGGWETLAKECQELARANTNGIATIYWRRMSPQSFPVEVFRLPMMEGDLALQSTNSPALPGFFAKLNPQTVMLDSQGGGQWSVMIKFFGQGATGARGESYYSLQVHSPPSSSPAVENSGRGHRRKITDSVFEVY